MGFLSSLSGSNVGDNTLNALKQNSQLLNTFNTTGNNIITTGEGQSADNLYNAQKQFDPYLNAGSAATGLYSDALGLNGADGNARATSAFQTSPGYDFALDQGTQAALRGASAAGMLNSGNTLTALTNYGQGQANQEYSSWLDRLNGLSGQGLSAANGQAGVSGAISNLFQSTADNRLGLDNTVTQGQMGINTQTGQIQDQQQAASDGFLGKLVSGGVSLGAKALSGGLF